MSGLLQKAKGIRLSRIVIPTIIIALLVSGSVIPVLWFEGDMWHKEPEKKTPPPPYHVHGGLEILDITGDRSDPPSTTINRLTILVTVYAGNNGIDISKLRVHWTGPTQNVVLNLNTASPTVTSATYFASDEVPIKTPRSANWDPGATPPTFFLMHGVVIYITIDLSEQNGINDPLAKLKTAQLYFEGVPGLPAYESFTTPYDFGTHRYIDLTNF